MDVQMTVWTLSGIGLAIVLGWAYRQFRQPLDRPVAGDELAIWPFEPMPLMTDSEVRFFGRLLTALPELVIFSQVQLSRIIEPSEEAESDRNFWYNRICRQSVDYVIVAQDRQTVLLVIELDDWTHESRTRQKQDHKKDKALASAGIAVMRYHADNMPDVQVLRAEVLQAVLAYNGNHGLWGAYDD